MIFIVGFIIGLAIGFIIGALVYRNNAKHAEELLEDKRKELLRLYKFLDDMRKKLEKE